MPTSPCEKAKTCTMQRLPLHTRLPFASSLFQSPPVNGFIHRPSHLVSPPCLAKYPCLPVSALRTLPPAPVRLLAAPAFSFHLPSLPRSSPCAQAPVYPNPFMRTKKKALPLKEAPSGYNFFYFAKSTARVSRMTLTLICPGYSISCSMRLAISFAMTVVPMSVTSSGLTMMRTSRPDWMA